MKSKGKNPFLSPLLMAGGLFFPGFLLPIPTSLLAQEPLFPPSLTLPTQGWVEGIGSADLDGDGRAEVVVLTQGGSFSLNNRNARGGVAVLGWHGSLRWEVTTSSDLAGYPALGDLNGDARSEIVFCEANDPGTCHVFTGAGELLWQTDPLPFPGMTNIAPALADINGDGYNDLVVVSYGGIVAAYAGPLGVKLWEKDLYAAYGEQIFSAPVVGDLDGDGTLEIAVGGDFYLGTGRGGLYVLDAGTGLEKWHVFLQESLGVHFEATSPLLVDLNGDRIPELVAALTGTDGTSKLLGFSGTGSLLFATPLPEPLGYTNPVAADLDNDGFPEIVVQGGSGTIYLFDHRGTLRAQRDLGEPSFLSPILLDTDLNTIPELVTGTFSTLYILHGATLNTLATLPVTSTAELYPTPIYEDTNSDRVMELFYGDAQNRLFLKTDLPVEPSYPWNQLQGNGKHRGSLTLEERIPEDPFAGMHLVAASLYQVSAATALPEHHARVGKALTLLGEAYFQSLRGNPHLALKALAAITAELQGIQGVPEPLAKEAYRSLAAVALNDLVLYLQRSQRILGFSPPSLEGAMTELQVAQTAYKNNEYAQVPPSALSGALGVRAALDTGSYTVYDRCSQGIVPSREPFEGALCQLMRLHGELEQLLAQTPQDATLLEAVQNLGNCLAYLPDPMLSAAFPFCKKSDTALAQRGDTLPKRLPLAKALQLLTRLYLDRANWLWRSLDPQRVAQAEALYAQGVSRLEASAFPSALSSFYQAVLIAMP